MRCQLKVAAVGCATYIDWSEPRLDKYRTECCMPFQSCLGTLYQKVLCRSDTEQLMSLNN